MKYLLRMAAFNVFALWMTTQLVPAFAVAGGIIGLFLAGFVLTILVLIVRPLLKILFIPITIITFGLLSWIINVIVLYLLTVLLPAVTVGPWTFPGMAWSGFTVPAVRFSYMATITIVALVVTGISNCLHYLSEE
jgi:putative membrane protein